MAQKGHIAITVSGVKTPLEIDVNSYTWVDVTDFAPRVIAGTSTQSQLGIYLDIAQEKWGHGFGEWEFGEPESYGFSGHLIDTRFGHIQLGNNPTTLFSAETASYVHKILSHRNLTVALTSNYGLTVITNHASLETGLAVGVGSIRDMISTGEYLLITGSDRMNVADVGACTSGGATTLVNINASWETDVFAGGTVKIVRGTGAGSTGTVVSNTDNTITVGSWSGSNPDTNSVYVVWAYTGKAANPPSNFDKLAVFGGFIWSNEYRTNYLHFWAEDSGLNAEGGGTADAAVVEVGPRGGRILNLTAFDNQLFVFRSEGAWTVGEDNLAYMTGLQYIDQQSNLNFTASLVWNGFLVYDVRNQLYKFKSGAQDISPPRWNEQLPYKVFGNWQSMVVRGKYLYTIGQSNSLNADESLEGVTGWAGLLATDGVGWHKLMDMPHGKAINQAKVFLDQTDNYIYIWNYTTDGTNNCYLYNIRLQAYNDMPYAVYPTTGNHYLYTSYYNIGYARIPKSFAALTLEGDLAAGQTCAVSFQVDDETSWTTLGTFNSQHQEIDFPTGTKGKRIRFRLNLQTTSNASTPVVKKLIIKVMLRPDVKFGVTTDVLISNDLHTAPRGRLGVTAKATRAALTAARQSVDPITFTDIHGDEYSAYLASVQSTVIAYENKNDVTEIAHCTFVFV